jgi:hypothetical protein
LFIFYQKFLKKTNAPPPKRRRGKKNPSARGQKLFFPKPFLIFARSPENF